MEGKKSKLNIVLIIILVILIITTIMMGIIYIKKQSNNSNENTGNISSDEESKGYYSNWNNNGEMNIDIEKYVKLANNYKENISIPESGRMSKVVEEIKTNSTIEVPENVLNTYVDDAKESIMRNAEAENVSLSDYLLNHYGTTDIDIYIESQEENYQDIIKLDLTYQALAKEYNISVTENDVRNYFKDALSKGYTYDELKDIYGEELMYKYTLEDKVQTKLKEVLKK